ncbi:hypothetical protein [Flavobacterium sp.]|jgi:hypothetical protein|uniref:hypothetical protein n=1 Tax=Flavobacterium sp. TaxID=239 RepID=UPI0037C0EFF1
MRKVFLLLLLPILSFAQEDNEKIAKGELKSNLFDLVVGKSVNVGYEYFLKGNQSLQLDVTAFDTYSYIDAGYLDENNLVGIQASYNIYFSKSKKHHGFVFYPFMKYRTGTQVVDDYYYNYNPVSGQYTPSSATFDLSGFEVGFGLGHKWLFNDKISLGVGSQIGRNLTSDREFTDNYSEIDFKMNITLGVRF